MNNGRTYKDFEKKVIGESDRAALTIVGLDSDGNIKSDILTFGIDEIYRAYIVTDEDVDIPMHYNLRMRLHDWVTIYDDFEKCLEIEADNIEIYRAGEMGCIIKAVDTRRHISRPGVRYGA